MKKNSNCNGLEKHVRNAIEELSRDLRANKFVNGQMQFTDITNRDYFLKAYGDRIRYCLMWNKFLVWNGTCWEIDKNCQFIKRENIFMISGGGRI